MSESIIISGFTARDTINPDFERIIRDHRDAILSQLAEIDPAELLVPEMYETDEQFEDAVIDAIVHGARLIHDGDYTSGGWLVPATRGLRFYAFGGSSYGDEPFEGYNDMCLALSAADVIPNLGDKLGFIAGLTSVLTELDPED